MKRAHEPVTAMVGRMAYGGATKSKSCTMPATFGTPGNDTLSGGAGDTIFGDAGDDTITLTGGGSAYGEAGDDTFLPVFPYSGGQFGTPPNEFPAPTELNGGAGYDTVSGANLVVPGIVHYGFYYGWAVNGTTGDLDLLLYGWFNNEINTRVFGATHTSSIERIILGGGERLNLAGYTRSIEIVGNALANTLTGGLAADILRGGDGNDTITVGEGDQAYGDAGSDTFTLGWTTPPSIATMIDGGTGNDTLSFVQTSDRLDLVIGSGGFSIGQATYSSIETIIVRSTTVAARTINITGSDASETFQYTTVGVEAGTRITFFGGGGDDVLTTATNLTTTNSYLDGGDGNDTITGVGTLLGGAGDDILNGYGTLRGGSGNDRLNGVGANLYGDEGDDILTAWQGEGSVIDGGAGVDTLLAQVGNGTININLTTGAMARVSGNTTLFTWTLTGIENVTGSGAVFNMLGNAQNNILIGADGADFLNGMDGDDTLTGGDGSDILMGGAGDDVLMGDGRDSAGTLRNGADTLYGEAGNDRLYGGAYDDTLDGGAGNDLLDGGTGNDTLDGGDGNDSLIGGTGRDQLTGGAGDDVLDGGDGDDQMLGGEGDDTVVFNANRSEVVISSDGGTGFTIRGPNGLDAVTGVEHLQFLDGRVDILPDGTMRGEARTVTGTAAADRLVGWYGDDVITGGAGEDILLGEAGNDRLEGGAGQDALYGGDGNDTLNGEAGHDMFVGGLGDDTVDGGDGDDVFVIDLLRSDVTVTRSGDVLTILSALGRDTLIGVEHVVFADGVYDVTASGDLSTQPRAHVGTAGADRLVGDASVDLLSGGNGNDILIGGRGNDTLYGGLGVDTAVFSGVRRQYNISTNLVSGTYAEGSDGDGFDILIDVEQYGFVDGVLTYSTISGAAQVMRLYSAALGRTPDDAGLAANVAALDTLGLQGVANLFVNSAEFQSRFGNLTNVQFLQQLYVFALGRQGDGAGLQAWLNAMDNGMTRAQVVVGFSESAENQTRTAATLAAGLWMPDAEAHIIARMYDATLDRLPDPGGLVGWVALYDGGMSLTQIAQSFVASPEFQARYGALSNQQFIEQLYRFCLNREGDAPGVQAWVDLLNNGTSRAQVVVGFSESPEHIALTAPLWSGGIRYAGGVAPQPAPLETSDAKGLHDAQVLPGDIDGQVHDPADLWLVPASKDHDAFVLPADPDGNPGWGPPVDDFMFAPLPAALPPPAVNDLHAVMPAVEMFPGDPAAGIHRNHLDLAWA